MSLSADGASIQINLHRVPPGWAAPTSGYFFDEAALVEFTTAAFTYEAESLAWQKAYWELDEKYKQTLAAFDTRLDIIGKKHEAAVGSYERELAKARRRERLPGIGFFLGPAYNGRCIELGAGIGLVWKM
jgi:hypothetical protein